MSFTQIIILIIVITGVYAAFEQFRARKNFKKMREEQMKKGNKKITKNKQ